MTPVGHVSLAYLGGAFFKKLPVPALIIGALLPDIDFMFVFFPWFDSIHRSVTHSLLFILTGSGVITLLPRVKNKKYFFWGLFLGSALHLLADSMMDGNPGNGMGIQLFWPFFDYYFMPFNLIGGFGHGPGWKQPLEQLKYSLPALLIETPLAIAALVVFWKRRKGKMIEER